MLGARWPAPLHSPSLTAPTLRPSPAGHKPSHKGDVEHDFPLDITCLACGTTKTECPTTTRPGGSVSYTYFCGGTDHCPEYTCDLRDKRYLVAKSIRKIVSTAGGLPWNGWQFQKGHGFKANLLV